MITSFKTEILPHMRLKHWIFLVNLLVIIIGAGVLAYLYFFDGAVTPELDITSLHTTKDTYERGELVEMSVSFCKHRDVPVDFQWTLIDDTAPPVIFKEKSIAGVKQGCFLDKVRPIEILPSYIAPGEYHFENRIVYQLNPVKRIEYVIKTNNFTVK